MTWPCIVALSIAGLLLPLCVRILLHALECGRKLNEVTARLIVLEQWKEAQS